LKVTFFYIGKNKLGISKLSVLLFRVKSAIAVHPTSVLNLPDSYETIHTGVIPLKKMQSLIALSNCNKLIRILFGILKKDVS
jgi:hypothetical protein